MFLGLGLSICVPGQSAFTPAQLSGAAHWYRADLGVTQSGTVSQWNDQIGSAHLVQATGANRPTYNASDAGYGGRPTIESTAATQYMAAAGTANAQPFTVWLVGEFSTASGTIFSTGSSAGTSPILFRSAGNAAANAGSSLDSGVASNAKHALLATFDDGASFIGVDNWLTGGVSGAAGGSDGADVAVFAYSDGLFGSVGKIAELLIQQGTPSNQEKVAMAAYLGALYGITVT